VTLITTNRADIAQDKLRREIEHAPQPVQDVVPIPGEGAVAASMDGGDIFLIDPVDNGRTDRGGSVLWVHEEQDWTYDGITYPRMLFVEHVWGESGKHVLILEELVQWLIDEGYGDVPITYERSGHPITRIADQLFTTADQISADGRRTITTPNQAQAVRTGQSRGLRGESRRDANGT
jgi:hypothetical protein